MSADSERLRRLLTLYEELSDQPLPEREARLAVLGRDDSELCAELEAMLRSGDRRQFLEPPYEPSATIGAHRPGDRVGPYTVRRVIGEGGMGIVYEAEQEQPRRKVALKTLRAGPCSDDTLRRLELEAEVLARLDHPSIARVLDAGRTPDGLPYLTMELVEGGRDLLSHVREERLDQHARLALFLEVCEAVEHGHRRGVIHRDLKPANVLVGRNGTAKVIDFGIARALHDSTLEDGTLDAWTRVTRSGEILGTLHWMAPEQVAGTADADTRTDVHALGCLLHWLLFDEHPFPVEGKPLAEVVRALRETAPVGPRRTKDRRPIELGWIVDRALEKDPADRYASVAELRTDVQNFLTDRPLLAGPPSTLYRLRKLARRHRPIVIAIALVLVAATVFGAIALRSLVREATEAGKYRAVSTLMLGILDGAKPYVGGRDTSAVELLNGAVTRLDALDDLLPEAEAPIRRSLARSYLALHDPRHAETQARRAHELDERTLPSDHDDRLTSAQLLATALQETGRRPEASALFDRYFDFARRKAERSGSQAAFVLLEAEVGFRTGSGEAVLAEQHASWMVAKAHEHLGEGTIRTWFLHTAWAATLSAVGRFEDGEREARLCVAKTAELTGPTTAINGDARIALAKALLGLHEWEEAETVLRGLLSLQVTILGSRDVYSQSTRNDLARVLLATGRPKEAIDLLSPAVDEIGRSLRMSHPSMIEERPASFQIETVLEGSRSLLEEARRALNTSERDELARVESALDTLAAPLSAVQEEKDLRATLADQEGRLGRSADSTLTTRQRLGTFLRLHGQIPAALDLLQENAALWIEQKGEQDFDVAEALEELGSTWMSAGEWGEAAECFERESRILHTLAGNDDLRTARADFQLATAWSYDHARRNDSARLMPDAIERVVRLQPEAPEVLICYLNLHNLCRLTGDSTVAEDAIRKAVDFAEDIAPVDHPLRAQAYYLFANFLDLRGDSAEALEWYQRAVEAMDESPTVPDEKREKYVEGLDACRKKVDGEEG